MTTTEIGDVEYSCAIYVGTQQPHLQECTPFLFRLQLRTHLDLDITPEAAAAEDLPPMPVSVQEWSFVLSPADLSPESIRIAVAMMELPPNLIDNFAAGLYAQVADLVGNLPLLASRAPLTFWMVVTTGVPDDESREIDRAVAASAEDFVAAVLKPASSAAVASLEKARLNESCIGWSCVVCLEELASPEVGCDGGEIAVRLPCSHSYHKDCIVQWLEINHVCPLCRHAMPTS